jgi:hypothetical protein
MINTLRLAGMFLVHIWQATGAGGRRRDDMRWVCYLLIGSRGNSRMKYMLR